MQSSSVARVALDLSVATATATAAVKRAPAHSTAHTFEGLECDGGLSVWGRVFGVARDRPDDLVPAQESGAATTVPRRMVRQRRDNGEGRRLLACVTYFVYMQY